MNKDTFVSTNKIPANHHGPIDDDNNFFMQSDNIVIRSVVQPESTRHLNDYDSNILKEDAYRDIQDELFKLEYKISKTEEEIKNLEKQIQSANSIQDYFLADSLYNRKKQLEDDLKSLTDFYKEASLSAKISGGFTAKFKDGLASFQKLFSNNLDTFISKLPGKFSSFLVVKNSLNKLENISKSVDDLMKCQYPYGEAANRYEQLSRYIAKANSIQSEIYKFIK